MTGVTVRVADPAQFDAVARLTVAAYGADGQLDGGHGYERTLADVPGRADEGEVLVAVDDVTGEVLGSVVFVLPGSRFAELSGPDEAEFRMLAVDPTAQGRGVGTALARACVDRAASAGRAGVVICTRSFATRAQRLYAGLGFTRLPERDWSPAPGVELLALRLDLTDQADVSSAPIRSSSS